MPLSPELRTILESNRPHEIEHFPLGIAAEDGLCGDDGDRISSPPRPRLDEYMPALLVRPPHANDRRSSAEPSEQRPNPIKEIGRRRAAVEVQLQRVHVVGSASVGCGWRSRCCCWYSYTLTRPTCVSVPCPSRGRPSRARTHGDPAGCAHPSTGHATAATAGWRLLKCFDTRPPLLN